MPGVSLHVPSSKWPTTWYSALAVVDTVGRYPALCQGLTAAADRTALVEVIACLMAYTLNEQDKVVPHSVFQGFTQHSFGQRKQVSDLAPAQVVVVALTRVEELLPEAAGVEVATLASSKGGFGVALPP